MNSRDGQITLELAWVGFLMWLLILGILKLNHGMNQRFETINQDRSTLMQMINQEDNHASFKN